VSGASRRPRVLYVGYANPGAYPPLQHGAHILAEAGCDVVVMGAVTAGTESIVMERHAGVRVRCMGECAPGWRQKLHYLQFAFWCLYWALRWRPDWIYASDPMSCPVALLASLGDLRRVIYHEHDEPVSAKAGGRDSVFGRIVNRARHVVGRRASLCIIPQANRLRAFVRQTGRRGHSVCVWNCPRRAEASVQREYREPFTVLYHGTIVPDRLPPATFVALSRLEATTRMRVVGYETIGHVGYVDELRRLCEELGVADRVEFCPPIPSRAELLAAARQCHIGLALMPLRHDDVNLRQMVGASNKPFDYMACGLAVVVSDLPEWSETYVTEGFATACNPESADSIEAAFKRHLRAPAAMQAQGEKAQQRILGGWNYESQFAPVVQHVLNGASVHVAVPHPAPQALPFDREVRHGT